MMRFVLLIFSLFTAALSVGLKCEEHPGYVAGMKPVFVYAFNKLEGGRRTWMYYHPRYTAHYWAPKDNPSSKKYYGLDWFSASKDSNASGSQAYIRLFLQRPAKVYLAVAVRKDPENSEVSLPGWKSEGYAERPDKDDFEYGIFQKRQRSLPARVYIFSKMASSGILDIAEQKWYEKNARGIETSGYWYLMFAEPNGDAPKAPAKPLGVEEPIKSNEKCPDSLHDLWVTKNTDESDEDTRNKKWRTWHPMWDPCHWCGYGHEHGSDSKRLMGYEPKYGYVAWKNDREDEDHHGFKGHVFEVGDYFIYWSIHIQTSSLRRVDERFHTIVFAVTDAKTKELLAEVNHKGFFGFLATRGRNGLIPLSPEDQSIRDELKADGGANNRRSINVIDMDNLDPRFSYQNKGKNILRGRYEIWTTGPLCAAQGKDGMITVDTTNPITALKSMANKEKVPLGSSRGDRFTNHDGSSRIVKTRNFKFGYDYCGFKLADFQGDTNEDGMFYTDARGKKTVEGPSTDSVKQYIKPGFELIMEGSHRFQLVDSWQVLYVEDGKRGIASRGFVINPEVN